MLEEIGRQIILEVDIKLVVKVLFPENRQQTIF